MVFDAADDQGWRLERCQTLSGFWVLGCLPPQGALRDPGLCCLDPFGVKTMQLFSWFFGAHPSQTGHWKQTANERHPNI